jgi:hypothetical protein
MSSKALPPSNVLRARAAYERLGGRAVAERFRRAGMLEPCADTGSGAGRRMVFFRAAAVLFCEREIECGRIPSVPRARKEAK